MSIYIFKDGQQSGPYEERIIIDQLNNGLLSPDDMGIRQGDAGWQPLRTIFPDAAQPLPPPPPPIQASQPPSFAAVDAPAAAPSAGPEPQYRSMLIPKVFFGLCLLGAILGFAAAAYYFYSYSRPSGDLVADLSSFGYRGVFLKLGIGMLVGGFFTFLALALTFKRKLIQSNGLRIGLRVVFILILLAGLGNIVFGSVSYFTYSPPYRPSTKQSESNELTRAFEEGTSVGQYETAVLVVPIGAGLFLFGLSGILMTKRRRDDA